MGVRGWGFGFEGLGVRGYKKGPGWRLWNRRVSALGMGVAIRLPMRLYQEAP